MMIRVGLGEIDGGQSGRQSVAMLHHQHDFPHTRLQQFEHSVLTRHHGTGVVYGQDLVPGLYPAVQIRRLALHHILHVDARLIGGFHDEQAHPAANRFDQFHRLHIRRR